MAHGSGGAARGGGPGRGAKGGDVRRPDFAKLLPGGFGGSLAVGTQPVTKSLLSGVLAKSQTLSTGQEPLARPTFGVAIPNDQRFTTFLAKKSGTPKTLLGL